MKILKDHLTSELVNENVSKWTAKMKLNVPWSHRSGMKE